MAAGNGFSCARMGGTQGLRCWGNNQYGSLGTGNTQNVDIAPASDNVVF